MADDFPLLNICTPPQPHHQITFGLFARTELKGYPKMAFRPSSHDNIHSSACNLDKRHPVTLSTICLHKMEFVLCRSIRR